MQKKPKVLVLILAILTIAYHSNAQTEDARLIKVLSYNIWNGFDWGNDKERKRQCIEWIKARKPDVVSLQELCGYSEEKLKQDALKWGHSYVQILKTEGYPTALTSNKPILLKERKVDEFWHGLLHCETYGIDFFVVHLSPADSDFRAREARMIKERIKTLKNDKFIILGDFNALSPIDATWMEDKLALKRKQRANANEKYSNLRNGEFDYSVIAEFLSLPAIDVSLGKMELQEAYTFPSPVLIGLFENTSQSIMQNRMRIDHILASPMLAKYCLSAKVFNGANTAYLSDHYPIMAEFKMPNQVGSSIR